MGENTFCNLPGGPGGWAAQAAGTYWRRRFTVLIIGLVAFALAAWTVSMILQVSPGKASPPAGRARPSGGGAATPDASAGRTAGSHAATGRPRTARQPARTTSAGGNGRSQASSASSAQAGLASRPGLAITAPAGRKTYPGITPAFCGRRDIVLSLSASSLRFGRSQDPEFTLSIVSTQQATCSFNLGSRHLVLVIREGPARVWSSADCPAGAASLVTALQRGVPTAVTIAWSRRTSSPGCSGRTRRVPGGVYTGYAVEGPLVSAPVTVRLN